MRFAQVQHHFSPRTAVLPHVAPEPPAAAIDSGRPVAGRRSSTNVFGSGTAGRRAIPGSGFRNGL
jgi:hypothetical protein